MNEEMLAILEKNGFKPLRAKGSPGGSDAADVTSHGIPCIDKMGAKGNNVHSTNEYASLDSLRGNVKRLATIINEI